MALISLHNITLGFGGTPLFEEVTLQVEQGERLCLLGRNGSGKSTLLKIITGETAPDEGEILTPRQTRIARLPQTVPRNLSGTVIDVVAEGATIAADTPPEAADWEARHQADVILSRMELDPDLPVETLSAGLKRRVLLARCLAGNPDVLLLDEPTNHLDIASIEWLEDFLRRHVRTFLFVTHDRMFLRRLAGRIAEMDMGRLTAWNCDYDTYLERKTAAEAVAAEHRDKFDKKLAQEEVWVRGGIKARRTRNEGRVKALVAMRQERRAWREEVGSVRMQAQEAQRTGRLVLEARHIRYSWADRPVIDDFSTVIMRGDKVGIIGPNGSGKTTLLNLLLGQLPPDEGQVRHGTHLEVGYFDQLRMQLDENRSVAENVGEGGSQQVMINGRPRHIIGYLQDFLFTPERARSPVSILSGGERNRLLLARLFARPANVLVLDEPTNDLDMETLELLENLLVDFAGTVLLVSHDRAFLNNVVTSTMAFEGDGRIIEYAGGYDDYLMQREQAAPVREPSEKPEKAAKEKKQKPKAERPRKLTFKEQHELEELPGRIEALESEQADLQNRMADPEFYRTGGDEIADATRRLEALEQELAGLYERWEALEVIAGNS